MNNAHSFRSSLSTVGLALVIAACGKSSTATQTNGSSSAAANPAAPTPATDEPAADDKPATPPAGFNAVTVKMTGAYGADRAMANSAATPDVVLCVKASTIFSVIHSGEAPSGDGNLIAFALATSKYHGAGTYAFDDGSATTAFVDSKAGTLFSEGTEYPATKTGALTITADGKSGTFTIKYGPGGDPPTGPVEVTGTFTCKELPDG